MDKLKMMSVDKVQENIQKIRELFPNVVTEVKRGEDVMLAVDFDVLKQELANTLIDEREFRYQFTWPDKQRAILNANTPIDKTLRPVKNDEMTSTGEDSNGNPYCSTGSVDFDNTQNLYLEGDNLDVLKLLQETYLGKIKMIYIDPPYNTGNDFVYNDDFTQDSDEYAENSGQYDNQGNRLVQNTESNGRFHTDWLNMIYPRLRLAKDLLSDDGLIFISIGSAEIDNLLKIGDDIFGQANRAGLVSRQMKTGNNQGKFFTQNTDYIVVYAKNVETAQPLKDDMSEDLIKNVYNKVQDVGTRKGEHYRTMGLFQASLKHGGSTYPITCPDGERVITPKQLPWRWNESTFLKGLENDEVVFIKTNNSPLVNYDTGEQATWNIYTKIWLSARIEEGQLPTDLILKYENRHAAKELLALGIPFDFPKPVALIKHLVHLICDKNLTVLDFFSGAATTAHAIMQLNAEDGGNRKFIMIQLPEVCDEKSEAYKAGYKNICEIGKERIRRAGKKIKQEYGEKAENLDIGFRVLKLDDTNMKPVYYTSTQYKQSLLSSLEDNIKEDRTPLDLLFQVMLELGKPLSAKIEEKEIADKKVFLVDGNDLIACFDSNVTDEVVKTIAQLKPRHVVFCDSGLSSDSTAANFDQIFATYSPNTTRKVL